MREIVQGLWLFDEVREVNVYLWQRADGFTLIDTGMPWHAYPILRALGDAGHGPHAVDRIIITHADFDHVGGLAYYCSQRRFQGMRSSPMRRRCLACWASVRAPWRQRSWATP